MKKKWISIVLLMLTVGMLAACGGNQPDAKADVPVVGEEEAEDGATEEKESGADEASEAGTGEKPEADVDEKPETGADEDANELSTGQIEEDTHEKAYDAVEKMLLGWNLGNTLDSTGEWIGLYTSGTVADYETAWGNPVTPDTLMEKIKALGFGAVRIPVTWRDHFDEEGNIDEAWMNRVQEVVDQAIAADLYCIINLHHDTGSDGWLRATEKNYKENAELFAKLWQQIAERFRDYPDTLLLEGFNEMLDGTSEWNYANAEAVTVINSYNQLFVDTVRATGGNNAARNLICCTYAAAHADSALNGFMVPKDSVADHLIGEVHFYNPYEFVTAENITWATPISEYSNYVEKTIDDIFARLETRMCSKGIPVIIGEFATDDKDNTQDRILWYTHVIEKANEQNITCFIWDNGNDFSMGHIDRVGDADAFPEIIEACVNAAR